ncbi:hypothetical protein BH20ACT5_BH20ACT5_07830 [soil metagenome]
MASQRTLVRLYPEIAAGGFTRDDGTVAFYTRVRALLEPSMTVVNLGAGRGRHAEDPVRFRRELVVLRGAVAEVVGVDPDPVVLENPTVDRAVVMPDPRTIPLPDDSADLVLADWVLEHVTEPHAVATEVDRVLRPGGWICARTPNKRGYWALGARLVPVRAQGRLLRYLQPDRPSRDVFPTTYGMNTPAELRELFPGYRLVIYGHHPPPVLGEALWLNRAARAALRWIPPSLAATFFVFLYKPTDSDAQRDSSGPPAVVDE